MFIKIAYAAASLQGVFLSILLFRSLNNRTANRILAVLLTLISFHLILVGFDNRDFFMSFPHLSRISWIIGTLYWPLLFLFVQKMLRYSLPAWLNYLLFLPFLFFLFIMLPYYVMSAEEKRTILDDFEQASQSDFGWINQTISVLHLIFQGLALVAYNKIEQNLKEEYSGDEAVRVKWLKEFLTAIMVVTIVAVSSFFARNFNIPLLSNLYQFHFFGLVILFYWVSFKALTSPAVFGLHESDGADSRINILAPSTVSHDHPKLGQIFETVRSVLENEKLYLNPTLTLTMLAEKAQLPRNVVSQAINVHSGGNFFDLINDHRVAEFKRLVADPSKKNLSLLGISQEAGFNSKATFYAIFKKKTGMTPAEYAATLSKSSN